MLYHCNIKNFFRGGFIGVDIFFVISGFLITSILINEWEKNDCINLKAFYIRRSLRLLPALLGLIIIFLFAGLLFSGDVSVFFSDVFWAISYVANWARIYSTNGPNFLGHTWSLSIEEQFYIVWPFLLVFLLKYIKSKKHFFLILTASAIGVAVLRFEMHVLGSSVIRVYNGLDTRADSLLLGCAAAFLYQLNYWPIKDRSSHVLRHISLAAAGGLFLIAVYGIYHNDIMIKYGYFFTALLAAVIVFCLPFLNEGLLVSILRNDLLIRVGKISYGLYLWHYPILRMLDDYFRVHWSMRLIIGLPLAFFAATISYQILEKPLLRKKDSTSLLEPARASGAI